MRDTSLRVHHGEYGIIVDVKVFTPDNCDELQPGVRQVVRCYIAQKRKLSVGDKMAGRHGNKGRCISYSASGRYALFGGWYSSGIRAESLGRAFSYEYRTGFWKCIWPMLPVHWAGRL